MSYLVAAAIVFGLNLLPAFAPPTWAVLVLVRLHTGLPVAQLVVLGAISAASGRYVLARVARHFAERLAPHRQERLNEIREWMTGHRNRVLGGLALFAVSPLPSGQLFVAAGLLRMPLGRYSAAFFAGRIVSYAVYVGGASAVSKSYGDVATEALRSPIGIATQLGFTVLVTLLPLVPRHRRSPAASG